MMEAASHSIELLPSNPSALPPNELKRKRSLSSDPARHQNVTAEPSQGPSKMAKTNNHLQINYLARRNKDDLAIASAQDSMPELVELLSQYHGVLERHESLACNLGARPLGPILIKRFERLFDGPPKVLKSHSKDGEVTWLDVVEFARNKPDQFNLGQMSEGVKVCQFYTKHCRVQISEEDFVLINSGIPQKMIPPQPIVEDEEKELGTLEILEDKLTRICHLADQVAARTRQLNHRLKGRRQAILNRRAAEPDFDVRQTSPPSMAFMNGSVSSALVNHSAMNARSASGSNGPEHTRASVSSQTRHELLTKFHTLHERRASITNADPSRLNPSNFHVSQMATSSHVPGGGEAELAALLFASNAASGQIPHEGAVHAPMTPSAASYHQHSPHSPGPHDVHGMGQDGHGGQSAVRQPEKEKSDEGPFKAIMVKRMEKVKKNNRVMPPCDRCRRLHMDCIKNLTACVGCTKKHAKCGWREVKEDELSQTYSSNIDPNVSPAPLYGKSPENVKMPDQQYGNDSHGAAAGGMAAVAGMVPHTIYPEHGGYPNERDGTMIDRMYSPAADAINRNLTGLAGAAIPSAADTPGRDETRSVSGEYSEPQAQYADPDSGGIANHRATISQANAERVRNLQNTTASPSYGQGQRHPSPRQISDRHENGPEDRQHMDHLPAYGSNSTDQHSPKRLHSPVGLRNGDSSQTPQQNRAADIIQRRLQRVADGESLQPSVQDANVAAHDPYFSKERPERGPTAPMYLPAAIAGEGYGTAPTVDTIGPIGQPSGLSAPLPELHHSSMG